MRSRKMRNSTGQLAFLSGPRFILFPDPVRPVASVDNVQSAPRMV